MQAADPAALGAWHRDRLGLDVNENGLWRQGAGPTVFATLESGTGYFRSRAQQKLSAAGQRLQVVLRARGSAVGLAARPRVGSQSIDLLLREGQGDERAFVSRLGKP